MLTESDPKMKIGSDIMKTYLIEIKSSRNSLFTTIYGDTPSRPFSIANNLWNYATPWTAAQRLEKLAQSWESYGHQVTRIYGTIHDMPTKGDRHNIALTIQDFQ